MSQTVIDKDEIEFSSLSMLDEIGKVFTWREEIHRAITVEGLARVDALFASGLIQRLQELGLIVESRRTDYSLPGYAAVIHHETAPVVAYPYEWSFEMLRRAAALILEVNRIAMTYGYQTKDCHPYNIVFFGDQPKFVDIGSFTRLDRVFSRHLYSYVEFCKCYLFPLTVWASGDAFTARRYLQRWKQMVPPEAYISYRLGGNSGPVRRIIRKAWEFSFKLQAIPHLLAGLTTSGRANKYRALARVLFAVRLPVRASTFAALRRAVHSSRAPVNSSTWGDYHLRIYGSAGGTTLSERFEKLIGIVQKLGVATVTDIGGNQGLLSEAIAGVPTVKRVICLDLDDVAVDAGYRRSSDNKAASRKLSFAVVNPFYPEVNWLEPSPQSRFRSELALALALTHHLVLDQGYSLDYILSTIKSYTTRYAIIEFMPLGLYSSVTGFGPSVPPWYTQEWFLGEFSKHFTILDVIPAELNRVIVVGELAA